MGKSFLNFPCTVRIQVMELRSHRPATATSHVSEIAERIYNFQSLVINWEFCCWLAIDQVSPAKTSDTSMVWIRFYPTQSTTLLCPQCEQLVQKIELSPTPDLQTPPRYLPESFKEWRFGLLIKTLVFPMLTRSPFTSNSQSYSFTPSSSSDSAMITRSSAYKATCVEYMQKSFKSNDREDAHPLSLQIH